MSVTLVVLSARPYTRRWSDCEVLLHYSEISNAAKLQQARYDAISKVRTPWFAYLDDDDDLPSNYANILSKCIQFDGAVVYTDELIRTPLGEIIRCSQAYSQENHLRDKLIIHHLAVCRTTEALKAIATIPRGHYCPELPLYWQLAKNGAMHLPEIGYIWNKQPTGMHTWSSTIRSWARALIWCKNHV